MLNAATTKGLITGIAMILLATAFFLAGVPVNAWYQYLIYVLYFAGIAWTIISHQNRNNRQTGFGNLFSQGFRCFIIVTILMVIFTVVLTKLNPEFAKESGAAFRDYLIKEKNTMPEQIDELVAKYEKQFTVRLVSQAIFGYLASGALFSVIIAGIMSARSR